MYKVKIIPRLRSSVKIRSDKVIPPFILQEKTATENGVVVPDSGYAGLSKVNVDVPPRGKKFTTGTVVFATNKGDKTVTHNLGSIPSVFFMIAKNVEGEFTFNTENSPPAGVYGYYRILLANPEIYFIGENISASNKNGSTLEWRNNNTTKLVWQDNTQYKGEPTETEITLSYRSAVYQYLAGIEYEWIAIE